MQEGEVLSAVEFVLLNSANQPTTLTATEINGTYHFEADVVNSLFLMVSLEC
jgi:hypothetical protein